MSLDEAPRAARFDDRTLSSDPPSTIFPPDAASAPRKRLKPHGLPAHIAALFFASLAITLLTATVIVFNVIALREASQRGSQLESARELIDGLQTEFLEAESAQRGFLLTGRDIYLQPYLDARAAYPLALSRLQTITASDAVMQPLLERLALAATKKMEIIDRTVEHFRSFGNVVPSDGGRSTMSDIRATVALMRAHISAEIELVAAGELRRSRLALVLSVLAGLVGVFATVIIYRAVGRETHRRSVAERELLGRTELLDAVVAATDHWIFVKDHDGRLTFANRQAALALDRPAAELVGTTPSQYLHSTAEAEAVREIDLRVIRNNRSERMEQTLTLADGARTFIVTKTPRHDDNGVVIGLIDIATDISDQKLAAQRLGEANERLTSAVTEKTTQLVALSRHLIEVSEEERQKLAGELHDELGSIHTIMALDLDVLLKHLQATDAMAASRLSEIKSHLKEARNVKNRIIADLRPLLIDQLGLVPALNHYLQRWSQASGVPAHASYPDALPALSPAVSLTAFRVVQESLTNAAKYARAKEIVITVSAAADEIVVEVMDDGIGVPPDVLTHPRSYGIVGMQQRVANLGGSFDIRPRERLGGTVVKARIPIA